MSLGAVVYLTGTYKVARHLAKQKRKDANSRGKEVIHYDMRRDAALTTWEWHQPLSGPLICVSGHRVAVDMELSNHSPSLIRTGEGASAVNQPVKASYMLGSSPYRFDLLTNNRTLLPRSLLPKDMISPGVVDHLTVAIEFTCPKNEGIYFIRFELVQEGVAWWHSVTAPERYREAYIWALAPPDFDLELL